MELLIPNSTASGEQQPSHKAHENISGNIEASMADLRQTSVAEKSTFIYDEWTTLAIERADQINGN